MKKLCVVLYDRQWKGKEINRICKKIINKLYAKSQSDFKKFGCDFLEKSSRVLMT